MFRERADRARARMGELGVDAVLLSVGPDLPYLTGYEAMPLERLTMLVLPAEGDATLVVPRLEAPRVVERPEVFTVRSWDETDDPVAIVADLVGSAGDLAIGDRTWARFLVDLQTALPAARFRRGSEVMGPLRARKDAAEVEALRRAGAAAWRPSTNVAHVRSDTARWRRPPSRWATISIGSSRSSHARSAKRSGWGRTRGASRRGTTRVASPSAGRTSMVMRSSGMAS